MYKLIIIDDGEVICDQLKEKIHWDELGLEYAGGAHDTLSADTLIRETAPDIVIIDAGCPGIDGIGVIERSRMLQNKIRFLIVSGCRDFDIARTVCCLQVSGYLEKPVGESELNASLKSICEEMNKDQLAQEHVVMLHKQISDQMEHILRRAIEDICCGRPDKGSELFFLGQEISGGSKLCSVMVVKLDARYELQKQSADILDDLKHMFLAKDEKPYRLICVAEDTRLVIVIGHDCEEMPSLREKMIIASEYVRKQFACRVSFGLCASPGYPDKIADLYCEAYSAVEMRRVRYSRVTRYDLTIPRLDVLFEMEGDIREIVRTALSRADFSIIRAVLDDIYEKLSSAKAEYGYPVCLIRVMAMFGDEMAGLIAGEFEEPLRQLIWKTDNEQKMYIIRHACEESFRDLFESYLSRKLKNENQHITLARNYIAAHYMEDISLQSIADVVHLNPVYFSNLFKTVTGMNYLDYVQKVRIENAKQKITASSLNIGEVAMEVGYQDKRYFSRIFKRLVGMNPGSYRKLYSDRK